MTMTANPGLYVHIPFCTRKCPYCDFYSVPELEKVDSYLERLALELRLERERNAPFRERPFASVFLGGGSPSVLSPAQILKLKDILSPLEIASDAEFTLEANPEDITAEKLAAWRALGVNRLSIGAQSLSPKGLSALGRRHTAKDTIRSVESALESGFRTSIDLIFGWPGETLEDLEFDLMAFLDLALDHLSLYALTLAPGTPLYLSLNSGLIANLPNEDDLAHLFLIAGEILKNQGYHRYEVSNFARPGNESSHNFKYWNRDPVMALGPAAHSFDGSVRSGNLSSLDGWMEALDAGGSYKEFTELLSTDLERMERLFLGLRLQQGVALSDVIEGEKVNNLIEGGFLLKKLGRLLPTEKGFLNADYVARELC
ncbi:MAG: radical SAM family heme chaperone HemW [Deltaproteobacteria bacterium]|jgi:oxygen-independent coproporphyrinogen-3 oxidase|nr:radical SAM family heme chaperone HemW [Deltaproteobacteria bacterium]